MKKCTYCGRQYSDEAIACEVDQQPLVDANTSAAASPKPTPREPAARTVKPALMTRLRSLHLYLGCIFAPMLLLFALTGIWQTLGIHGAKWMSVLENIHTSHSRKQGVPLTGPLLKGFIVTMAVAFIATTILGIIMAVKYGRNRRAAYSCLAFGIVFPALLILIRLIG